ncbi:MAG TPA: PQQ-dependent sugar dehydrogenase [Actinomycetota bacterium]|jgi:glucose/arabinose dehydrogenase|nr:PQQ-dependent sugar dehydrogenase [Actinomycetota bacterium]
MRRLLAATIAAGLSLLPAPATGDAAPRIALEVVVSGVGAPVGVVDAGRGRLLIVGQDGLIHTLRRGRLAARPFLDLTEKTEASGEQGLLGLALHPRFARNGRLFVNYTDLNGDTVVAEYRARRGRAIAASERVLLTIDQPFANHNGGHMDFGPDGYLYIATGDGGLAGDPMLAGRRLDTLLAKLLRIDVDSGDPYGIPADNPFTGVPGARGEIWATGLRNPWRFSFDDGSLWIADVGQFEVEEVNRVSADDAGVDYGWNLMEGDRCFPATVQCPAPPGIEAPYAVYGHDLGCAVTGGYVYRGREVPALRGTYVFADYCSGLVFGVPAHGPSPAEPVVLLESGLAISSFGLDRKGRLYVTDLAGGAVYRVVAP